MQKGEISAKIFTLQCLFVCWGLFFPQLEHILSTIEGEPVLLSSMSFFCISVRCMLFVTGKEKQLDRVQSRMESIQKSLSVQVGLFFNFEHLGHSGVYGNGAKLVGKCQNM